MQIPESIRQNVLANKNVPEELKFQLNMSVRESANKQRVVEKIVNCEYVEDKEGFRRDVEAVGLDLSFATLTGADLSGLDLSVVNLSGASISGCNLTNAKLRSTNLMAADLSFANFRGADLTGANLTMAKAVNSKFVSADVCMANFRGSDIAGADFSGSNLIGADLSDCNLRNVNFMGCSLTGVSVQNSDMDEELSERMTKSMGVSDCPMGRGYGGSRSLGGYANSGSLDNGYVGGLSSVYKGSSGMGRYGG